MDFYPKERNKGKKDRADWEKEREEKDKGKKQDDEEEEERPQTSNRRQQKEEEDADDESRAGALEGQLHQALEDLTEKRTSVRVEALRVMKKNMEGSPGILLQFLESRKDTVYHELLRQVKKGVDEELIISMQTLGSFVITLGLEVEELDLPKTLFPFLKFQITDEAQSPAARSAACELLAISCFIGVESESDTMTYLDFFHSLFQKERKNKNYGGVWEELLAGWGLLATTISPSSLHHDLLPKCLTYFGSFLENDDLNVRIMAGENIAFLIENARSYLSTEEEEFELEWLSDEVETDVRGLVDQIQSFSQERNRHVSKKESLKQRSGFKEIYKSIESGFAPETKLTMNHQHVVFETWRKIKQYHALRDVLGQGFQAHFLNNELLPQIFGIKLNSGPATNGTEQKLNQSFASKARSKGRSTQRKQKGVPTFDE